MSLDRRSVLVLGLGESGLAMARWCLREGARVRVADTRDLPPKTEALRQLDAGIDLRLGPFTEALFDGIDLVAISPGLSPMIEPLRGLLGAARGRGVEVCGEIELFAQKLAALKGERGYAPRVVAITGTNGKTTVTRLVGALTEASGRKVAVAGNVSPAALAVLADRLDSDDLPDVWVLELSSFQLATTRTLDATSATVLNITQDHLDWHGDMEAYAAAKAGVFGPTTIRVLNRDDPRVAAMQAPGLPMVSFGLGPPSSPGSFGVVGEDAAAGLRWLAVAQGDDPEAEARGLVAPALRKGKRPVSDASLVIRRLIPVDALAIRGDHNVSNVLAALALGRAIGLPMPAMLRAASQYRGEPHRVQRVARKGGIDWIDDSKGTNVGATVAALEGLGQPIVLIAGGDGKGQDFSPLAASVARHARAVLLIGKDRVAIRTALAETTVPLFDCDRLEDAVDAAARIAQPGDAVLLSPACASLDMFRDYGHRAEVFVAAVDRLGARSTEAEAAPC